jgi:hypothetical protein
MWRQIKGWDNYLISNKGEIKSFHNQCKILKQHLNSTGYYRIWLYDGKGFRKRFFVHQLVCLTFKKNPNNYKFIDHKNRIRIDNRVNNLRWCSVEQNLKNRTLHKKTRNRIKYKSEIMEDVPF